MPMTTQWRRSLANPGVVPWGARHDKPNVWPMAYERPAISVERPLACGHRRRETQPLPMVPTEGALSAHSPSCRALAEQPARRSPLAAHGAARRNTGEHLGHPQHILVVPLQRTPVPCRRGRGQDLRLWPHRRFVARPLASPLRSRRAGHCTNQLTHQRTKHASNTSADDSFTVNVENMCGHTAQPPHPDHHPRAVRPSGA